MTPKQRRQRLAAYFAQSASNQREADQAEDGNRKAPCDVCEEPTRGGGLCWKCREEVSKAMRGGF